MRPTKQAQTVQSIVIALTLILLAQTLVIAAPPSSKTSLQRRRTSLNLKIRQVRNEIHQKRVQATHTKNKLYAANHQVRSSRSMVQYATGQLMRKKIELHKATLALESAKKEYEQSREEASDRLVAIYERGEPGYMELLLSSEDFGDMLERAQLAKYMVDQDRAVMQQLDERKQKLDAYQNQVESKTREVAAWQQRVRVMHRQNLNERNIYAATLDTQRAKMDALEAELAALERDSAAVASMLQQMMRTSAGRRRYNTRYAGPVGGLPVNGRITSSFGYRTHPILRYRRLHTGVDIAAPSGTPIFAAGGGEVIFAGWRGGYGNTVMIDHGGGKVTLYGHMSGYNARVGQVVTKRSVIGFVGSTGMSTGPHLHYEVRINGTPVSPL